ncbi:MAG: metallophosphoesterase, partial [Eubacteriales bacterium]|nr:metallophosphoesterase [Eubacteriales bacterium]
HDHSALAQNKNDLNKLVTDLEKLGIEVLLNKTCPIVRNGKYYNIIGIDDIRSGRADVKKALESRHQPSCMDIAFSHNPDTVLMFPKGEVDYVMSGHFHGGQVWMPFRFEFLMLRSDVLCKRRITRGMHKVNGIMLYISRGLGNVIAPLRFLSRPEITVFRFP